MPGKSLLILQGTLPEYRRPVFDRLGALYDVTVAHSGRLSERPEDQFRQLILPVRSLGPFRLHRPGLVRRLMAQSDVTVAMFDLGWPAYVAPVLDPARSGRFILWGHRYGHRPLANRLRETVMRRADALLMYGWEHHAQMIAAGIDPAKIYVAPNTMQVGNHRDTSGEPKSSLLFVGRLQERKRLDLALASFAQIVDQLPPGVDFDIVGDGEPMAALKALAASLGIGARVHFHGAVTDDERLAPFFARAFAYVSPGPVGLSVLHSFAYGVPVVTLTEGYHGPEFHNLIHGENGLVVERESDFAAAMQQVVLEPGFSRRLGSAAYRRYTGDRSFDSMINGFVKAIEAEPDSGQWAAQAEG